MKQRHVIVLCIIFVLIFFLYNSLHKENKLILDLIEKLEKVEFFNENQNNNTIKKDENQITYIRDLTRINKDKINEIRNIIRNFGVIRIKNKEHIITFLLDYLFISSKKMEQNFLNKYRYNFNNYDLSDSVIRTIWLISPEKTVEVLKKWKYLKTKENIYDTYIVWRVIAVFKILPDSCELNQALENFLENNRNILTTEEIYMILEKQFIHKYNINSKNNNEKFFILVQFLKKIQNPFVMNNEKCYLEDRFIMYISDFSFRIKNNSGFFKIELLKMKDLYHFLDSKDYSYDEKCGLIYFFILNANDIYSKYKINIEILSKQNFLNLKEFVFQNNQKITKQFYDKMLLQLELWLSNSYKN